MDSSLAEEAVAHETRRHRPTEREATGARGMGTQRGADDERVACLEQLGAALELRGWTTTVTRPVGGPPLLRVTNPKLTLLSDTISCCPDADGTWTYAWGWGEPVGTAEDLRGAAEKVERVLGAGVEA